MDELVNYLINSIFLLWGDFKSQPFSYQLVVFLIVFYLLARLLVWIVKVVGLQLYAYCLKKKDIYLLRKEMSEIKVDYKSEYNFSFVVEDLVMTPIEERDTFFNENDKKETSIKRQIEKLHKYYEAIKKEIKDSNIPNEVLSEGDIDYILQYVFTEDRILKAIEKLNKKRKENDPRIAFIGNKLGLYDFRYEKKKLIWTCYRTDHFTWMVFKELCSDKLIPEGENLSPHSFFNTLCKRLKKYQKKENYCNVLMHTLCYIFSSLGIDALVVGKDSRNNLVSLASIRSASIDRSHISRIHVSIDESFSDTDLLKPEDYSVERWLKRGIEEEIGILSDNLKDIKITYTDFSIVCGNYGEIGLSAIVESNDLDEWLIYPGKDKVLESAGMFLIKVPGFLNLLKILFSPKKGLQTYVGKTMDSSYAKFPWVEFAVPIYIRTYLRKLTFPVKFSTALLTSSVIAFLCSIMFEDKTWSLSGSLSLVSLCLFLLECISKRKYFFFSSWYPLWNGNVKTLQLTGQILKEEKGNVNNGLYMTTKAKRERDIALKDIKILEPPLTSIRKSYEHEELPISFYRVASKSRGKRLRFFSVYYKNTNPRSLYYYTIRRKKNGKKEFSVDTYSFNFGMQGDITFKFDKTLKELSTGNNVWGINENSLKCYFKLHGLSLKNYYFCNRMPNDIHENYQLCDLYEYKDAYYWSAFHRHNFPTGQNECECIAKLILEDYYGESFKGLILIDSCVKRERNATSVVSYQCCNKSGETIQIDFFCLEDKSKIAFQKKVNSLLSRSLERYGGKMVELETIALQYMLVREDIYIAEICYNNFQFLNSRAVKQLFDKISSLIGLITTNNEK